MSPLSPGDSSGDFQGRIGRYYNDSQPWWPPEATPPAGAPNVVVVVLDDVGFAQFGCYGSDISTPTFDDLAAQGLQFTNFHTTAVCSATRACVMTGRNHHSNGMGRVIEVATGFPGYNARIPRSNGRREVAPDPRGRLPCRRQPQAVAPGEGVRPLLRVHGRGDPPVRPLAH